MRHLTQSERFARNMWLSLYFQASREAEHAYQTARELYQRKQYEHARRWQVMAMLRARMSRRARVCWAALKYGGRCR